MTRLHILMALIFGGLLWCAEAYEPQPIPEIRTPAVSYPAKIVGDVRQWEA